METRIVNVTAGVGGLLREDCYAEVQVLAQHEGTEPLKARLEVACRRKGGGRIITTVERAVELPPHSRKQVALPLLVPPEMGSLEAALWVGGRRVARKAIEPSVLSSAVGTVLIVGEDNLNLTRDNPSRDGDGAPIFPLSEGGSPRYDPMSEVVRVGYVSDWTSLPSQATGYEGVDTMILLNAPPRTFDAEQQRALTRWASEGGTLIVCAGGSPSAMQQSFLASLLPVTLTTQTVMRDLRPLALLVDNPPIPQEKMPMVVARPRQGAAVIAGEKQSPMVVKGAIGYFGTVVYLAFDPLREPFRSWDKRTEFWRGMLRWCEGNGQGPTFTGIKAEELNALIREAKVVNVPSRFVFLAPMVAFAVLMLLVTLFVIRWARRWDWRSGTSNMTCKKRRCKWL